MSGGAARGGPGLTTIADAHPRFWVELVLWILSANKHSRLPKRVYFVGDIPTALVEFARRSGCDIRFAEPLILGAPHCNKLIPFLDPDGFADQIVTDTDVYLTAELGQFFRPDVARLAPNNHARPPLPVFEALFLAAGIPVKPEVGTSLFGSAGGRETYAGNVSAGVIMLPSKLRSFARAWLGRALWMTRGMTGNPDLLGRYSGHVDQISFAVAAAEQDLPFRHLPAQANAILQILPEIRTVLALHLTSGHIPQFAKWFNADGTLRAEDINPALAQTLAEFNVTVRQAVEVIEGLDGVAAHRALLLNPAYRR